MEDQALAHQAVNEVIFAAIRNAVFETNFRNIVSRISAPVFLELAKSRAAKAE